MTDDKKSANINEIPVEDFGLGVAKLVSQGLSGVLGTGRGDAATLFKSLRAKASEMMKKVESGFACGTGKKTD